MPIDYQYHVTEVRLNDFRLSIKLENDIYEATMFALSDMTPSPSNITVNVKPKLNMHGLNIIVSSLQVFIQDPELSCLSLPAAKKLFERMPDTLQSAQALQNLFDELTVRPQALLNAESLKNTVIDIIRHN